MGKQLVKMEQIKQSKLFTLCTVHYWRAEQLTDHCEEGTKEITQLGIEGWVGVCQMGKGHAMLSMHYV